MQCCPWYISYRSDDARAVCYTPPLCRIADFPPSICSPHSPTHPVAPLHHRAITLLLHRTIALAPLDLSPALSPPTPSWTHAQVRRPIYGPTRCACLCHFACSHPRVRHHLSLLIATNAVGMQVVSGASLLILFFPIFFFVLTPPTPCSRRYSFPWLPPASSTLRMQHVPHSCAVATTAPLLQDEDTTVNRQGVAPTPIV